MNHFQGITPEERWKNDLLNEVRQIRQALERNAQAVEAEPKEQIVPHKKPGRRPRQKGAV